MAAPEARVFSPVPCGHLRRLSVISRKNPIKTASFLLSFNLLPLGLWATAKRRPCDRYFPDAAGKTARLFLVMPI
jgi:hypothetical protein